MVAAPVGVVEGGMLFPWALTRLASISLIAGPVLPRSAGEAMSLLVDIDGIRIDTAARPFAHLEERAAAGPAGPAPVRVCYAAAHVVMRGEYARVPHAPASPGSPAEIAEFIDWEATAALRQHLGAQGFGIAEAMDTAQRFELGWTSAARLIEQCGALGLEQGFVAGVTTDVLGRPPVDEDELVAAVADESARVRACGGVPVLLPQAWLLQRGYDATGFVRVYERLFERCDGAVVVHWLGPMFAADLDGYFPGDSFDRVMAAAPRQARACKLSLLDDAFELAVRRALRPRGQVVMTGDDFHFGELILGGDPQDAARAVPPVEQVADFAGRPLPLGDFSHALLGILDGVAVPFALALRLLAVGDVAGYRSIASACEQLGQHVFRPPTQHYKAGLAFLAWLNGRQDQFMLVNHAERSRDRAYYVETARRAAAAGALTEPEVCAERLRAFDRDWKDTP